MVGGTRGELADIFREPVKCLWAGDRAVAASLHGTDDGGGAECSGQVNEFGDELAGPGADGWIGIGQPKFADQPAGSRSQGRQRKVMFLEEGRQPITAQRGSGWCEDLHGVVSELRGGGD